MKKKTLTVGRTTAAVVDYLLEFWGQINQKYMEIVTTGFSKNI